MRSSDLGVCGGVLATNIANCDQAERMVYRDGCLNGWISGRTFHEMNACGSLLGARHLSIHRVMGLLDSGAPLHHAMCHTPATEAIAFGPAMQGHAPFNKCPFGHA